MLFSPCMRQHIGGVALAPRGLGEGRGRIFGNAFLPGLVVWGFNPLPAKAVLPLSACAHRGREIFGFQRLRRCGYPLARTGGEKYSDFSDSGAVAIRLRAQGERNLVFFQRLSRYGYAGTGGEKPGFCSYPVAMAICRW